MSEKLVFLFTEKKFERLSKILGSTLVSFAKVFKGKKICIIQRIFSNTYDISDNIFKEEARRLADSIRLSSNSPFCTYASIGDSGYQVEIDRFLNKTVEHILIDLKNDDYHQYFELYFDREKKSFNDSEVIYIESYIGCEFILKAIEKKENMHIIFDRGDQSCYSDYISNKILKFNEKVKSVAMITNQHEIEKKYCHFNAEKNLIEIVKDSEDRITFLFKWIELIYQDFDYYYSYAKEDGVEDIISKMIYFFKLKMQFANPNIDTQENKSFIDIENYVSKLVNGKMVIALIGDNYLFKPFPMFEIISILEKNDLFIMSNNCISFDSKKVDLLTMENKFFPILFGKKAHTILDNNGRTNISEYWDGYYNDDYPAEKINKIKKFINPALEILSRLNYQPLKKFTQSNKTLLKNYEEICKILIYQANLNIDLYNHIKDPKDL